MKDQLSALMDGELEIESFEHVITSVRAGGELKDAWQCYHLIGDAMRGDVPVNQHFTSRVMQALEGEPTVLAPNNHAADKADAESIKKHKFPMFWSVAASAAAVVFVGVVAQQQLIGSEEIAPIEIAQNPPIEYLAAHQASAPSGLAYYIQTANYTEPQK